MPKSRNRKKKNQDHTKLTTFEILNKKHKSNMESNKYITISSKPKKWKFVSIPLIYSNEVVILDDILKDDRGYPLVIGHIEVKYKLITRYELDKEWFDLEMMRIFNTIPTYQICSFERDKSTMPYIRSISINKELYKQTQRRLKFERILNEN